MKYICEFCEYETSSKCRYNEHIMSDIHEKILNDKQYGGTKISDILKDKIITEKNNEIEEIKQHKDKIIERLKDDVEFFKRSLTVVNYTLNNAVTALTYIITKNMPHGRVGQEEQYVLYNFLHREDIQLGLNEPDKCEPIDYTRTDEDYRRLGIQTPDEFLKTREESMKRREPKNKNTEYLTVSSDDSDLKSSNISDSCKENKKITKKTNKS